LPVAVEVWAGPDDEMDMAPARINPAISRPGTRLCSNTSEILLTVFLISEVAPETLVWISGGGPNGGADSTVVV
jgi:hypothetical protein